MTTTVAAPAASNAQVTPQRIMQMAWGYAPPLVLEAAIRHRVFDVLDAGPMTMPEIAAATGTSQRGIGAILNLLVGFEFLSRDDAGRFSLTPESSTFLVSTKPSFHGGIIRHTSEHLLPKWLGLNEIVVTGKPARAVNKEDVGGEFFRNFVTDIFPMSYPSARELAAHLNLGALSGPVSILDLAAGSGVWSIALAQTCPSARVTVVDWPEVTPVTRSVVERHGFSDRYSYAEGDLLEANFGSGHTVAALGHILHSEGEARSKALLARTFEALAPGGTIAIAEFLVNADRRGPVPGLIFAINMLVNTDEGSTYSFEEISEWLLEAGFTHARTLAAPGPSPLILATKP